MLFRIAKENQERAARAFTVERTPKVYGYTQSAILTPKNKRLSYSYQIDILDNTCIVCTVRHIETDTLLAVVKLSNYTTESIEVEHGELYKNCSAYPYRREYNDKYLKKYDQIACIVHGAIAAGLLFDTAEATTAEETNTTGQNTACTDTEPQRATADAQTESRHKYGMRLRGYSIGAQPAGVVERADDPTGLYYDIITYNRELTPEELDMYSLTPLDAPTSTENAPQEPETKKAGETTTGAEKDAQRATQRAAALANTPETWEEIPERTETAAPAYIVQCRSKRRPWTDYSSPATLEECEQIKERAEARHVLNQNGEPIMYRIAPATTPNDKTTGGHTTQTAHNAPKRTETTEAEHVPTATQTEPPRATAASTTGDREQTTTAAAPTPSGDRSTANKMTGSHAGPAKEMTAGRSERRKRYLQRMIDELARKRRKARRDAKEMTTGRTTPPRHTCENAPQGPETSSPGQDTTGADTEPPRAAGKATPHRQRGSPDRRKVRFFDSMQKSGQKNGAPGRRPFCSRKNQVFDPESAGKIWEVDPTRVQNLLRSWASFENIFRR